MDSPCMYCDHRSVGCHSHCEAYAGYDAKRIEMRKRHLQELDLDTMQVDRFIRAERSRKAAYQRNRRNKPHKPV